MSRILAPYPDSFATRELAKTIILKTKQYSYSFLHIVALLVLLLRCLPMTCVYVSILLEACCCFIFGSCRRVSKTYHAV